MVGSAGFEPATFAVSGRRPNQASPTLLDVLDDEPTSDPRAEDDLSSFPNLRQTDANLKLWVGVTMRLNFREYCSAAMKRISRAVMLAAFTILALSLTNLAHAGPDPAFYLRTDRASYSPGDSGQLLITVHNEGD